MNSKRECERENDATPPGECERAEIRRRERKKGKREIEMKKRRE
jgi:hypothetical protein